MRRLDIHNDYQLLGDENPTTVIKRGINKFHHFDLWLIVECLRKGWSSMGINVNYSHRILRIATLECPPRRRDATHWYRRTMSMQTDKIWRWQDTLCEQGTLCRQDIAPIRHTDKTHCAKTPTIPLAADETKDKILRYEFRKSIYLFFLIFSCINRSLAYALVSTPRR